MPQSLRLAFVSTVVPPGPTGQARVLDHLTANAPSLLFITDQHDFDPKRTPDSPQKAYRVLAPKKAYFPQMPKVRGPLRAPFELAAMARATIERSLEITRHAASFETDAIVACTSSPFDIPASALACAKLGIPLAVYIFDDPVYQWPSGRVRQFAKLMQPLWNKLASAIFAPNEAIIEEVSARLRRRVTLVRNPVTARMRQSDRLAWPAQPPNKRIVYTGSVYHAQADAFVNLVQALKQLQNWSLHIYTNQSPGEVASYGIMGDNIFTHPHVELDESYNVQSHADVLFLPLAFHSSIQEVLHTSAPMKMGEYLASGRPILAHAPAGAFVSRHISEHRAGFVVDEPRAELLAKALTRIENSASLREEYSANAKSLAEEYMAENANRAFWSVIAQIVRPDSPARPQAPAKSK